MPTVSTSGFVLLIAMFVAFMVFFRLGRKRPIGWVVMLLSVVGIYDVCMHTSHYASSSMMLGLAVITAMGLAGLILGGLTWAWRNKKLTAF